MRVISIRAGRLKGKVALVVSVAILFIFFFYRGVHNISDRIMSAEITSLSYEATVVLKNNDVLKRLGEGISQAQISNSGSNMQYKYKLSVNKKNSTLIFLFSEPGTLFEARTGRFYMLKNKGASLEAALKELERQNPYGEFLTWDIAKKVFLKHDKARVVDFESGLDFWVQRRAGSSHADVQPLTATDSAIMKKIYGGKWSWRRRAVIVEVKGRRIAASMNGMPHGSGAIRGNKFNGHSCIHFRDSKLHDKNEDLAHQIMVWKAAGMVEQMLADASPEKIITVMLVAMEQGDYKLAARLVQPSEEIGETEVIKQLKTVKWMAVSKIGKPRKQGNLQSFNLKISYGLSDGTQVRNRPATFTLVKVTDKSPWKISAQGIIGLLKKQKETAASLN